MTKTNGDSMLGKKDASDFNTSGDLNTIIGKGSFFEGALDVQSTIRVDGKVKGKVKASDSLVVGKEGEIEGEITVRNAIIGGKIKGKLDASGKVVLETKSVFNGELKSAKLVIDEGAVFDGTCSMSDNNVSQDKQAFAKAKPAFGQKVEEATDIKIEK